MVLECARGPEPVSPPPSGLRSRTPAMIPTTGEFTERQRGFRKRARARFLSQARLLAASAANAPEKQTWDEARACAAA